MDDDAVDPDTLDTAAIAMHEMYESFLRAGFDTEQAFRLIEIQWQILSTQ